MFDSLWVFYLPKTGRQTMAYQEAHYDMFHRKGFISERKGGADSFNGSEEMKAAIT